MGNCLTKQHNDDYYYHQHLQQLEQTPQQQKIKKKSTSEIAPADQFSGHRKPSQSPPPPEATLCGDPASPATFYVRFALQYKPLSLRFFPSQMPLSLFTLRFEEDDPVSGSSETVLQYVETKLPEPPLLVTEKKMEWGDAASFPVIRMAALQHRSMTWHLERVVRWGKDLATRGGKAPVDPSMGTPRMELKKFGKSYGKLLEILLEHAQMEERVIFPIFTAADRGVCKCVNEEHARDLPIMNGIKESIKSIGVLDAGTPNHREALNHLSTRLEKLQENCRGHFGEEERNLFPLMEAADSTMEQQRRAVEQSIDVMQATHSHNFRFFMEGLLPHEALEYADLLINCMNKEKVISLLCVLVDERDQKGANLHNDPKFQSE